MPPLSRKWACDGRRGYYVLISVGRMSDLMLKGAAGGVRGHSWGRSWAGGDLISQEGKQKGAGAGVPAVGGVHPRCSSWDRARGQSRASVPGKRETCLQLRRGWGLQEGVLGRDFGQWGLGLRGRWAGDRSHSRGRC